MANVAAILLLACSFSLSTGYMLIDDDENFGEILNLVAEYSIKAEKIDLLSDEKLPIQLWYSEEYNRSRADVFDGMVRRFYYWGDNTTEENGEVYMVYPKTTEYESNVVTCFKTDMNEEAPSDVFPNSEDYYYAKYSGKTQHEGRAVDKWEVKIEDSESRSHTVLYTYRTERGGDVPVQLIKKMFNRMKGTIYTHVIINYYNYNPMFCEEELDAKTEETCEEIEDNFQGHKKALHPAFPGDLDVAFNSFKEHHNKNYQSKNEHNMRKKIFHKNWQLVVDYNRQDLGFKLALNHLSDLTPEERRHRNKARLSKEPSGTIAFPHNDEVVSGLPEEYDMRLEGVISPIKNQGDCGSCWTFGTTAAVEGTLARLDGRILDLSEQSLIDCNWDGDNEGCNGGWPKVALQHIVKFGLPLDEDYGGYKGQNGYCHIENATDVFKIRGYTLVTPRSQNAMKVALYKYGPVVVILQVNDAFNFYSSGIFYDTTCEDISNPHAVAVVGYGVRNGDTYWIVKNSWGESWGEDGYMLISTRDNNCFVLDEPYYAVV